MLNITCILARSSDDELMKIVFGVGAVIVWGLFQLIGAVAKKAEEAKRRQRYGRLPEDVATRGGLPPLPVPVGTIPGQRKQNKAKVGKARAPRVAPAPPPQPVAQQRQQVRAVASGVRDAAASRARVAGAPAGQIARLLRRPESLRAALIMNEVMSKPVALREAPRG
jgi:hypothetical protein